MKVLAQNENLYSVRFMGDRGYLVTFHQTDPFFVIDLSNPEAPKVAGELKIPGYSSFLQPYDENHVIGLGAETTISSGIREQHSQTFTLRRYRHQQPNGNSKLLLSKATTQASTALNDPKAFLFDLQKQLASYPCFNKQLLLQHYRGQQYGQLSDKSALSASTSARRHNQQQQQQNIGKEHTSST